MSAAADAELQPAAAAIPAPRRTAPYYWSLRRELWENRSIWMAPLIVAALMIVAFLWGDLFPPHFTAPKGRPAPHFAATSAYDFAAVVIMLTGSVVGIFYCLAALNGERRDRSILFWKSLPVSDLTTVLSKASIPAYVLPVVVIGTTLATQLVMLIIASVIRLVVGKDPWAIWGLVFAPGQVVNLIYGIAVITLWYAPIWSWLLLVSAWARRMTFVWAVAPPVVLCVIERLAFSTTYLFSVLDYRLTGAFGEAWQLKMVRGHAAVDTQHMDPGKFLAAPGLWVGLGFAAACIAAAVWLRRRREPV